MLMKELHLNNQPDLSVFCASSAACGLCATAHTHLPAGLMKNSPELSSSSLTFFSIEVNEV